LEKKKTYQSGAGRGARVAGNLTACEWAADVVGIRTPVAAPPTNLGWLGMNPMPALTEFVAVLLFMVLI
jgi:hypothetical protein